MLIVSFLCLVLVTLIPPVDASQAVSYSVSAFITYNNSVSVYSMNRVGAFYNLGGGGGNAPYGYVVEVLPNDVPGYLVVSGYYNMNINQTNRGSNSWTYSTSVTNANNNLPAYYYISDSLSNGPSFLVGYSSYKPFPGIAYIPAHSNVLYLWVFTSGATTYGAGAYRYSDSSILFLPDNIYSAQLDQIIEYLKDMVNGASGDSVILQQIFQTLEQIRSIVTSDPDMDDYSQSYLDQIDQIMEEIEELNKTIDDNTNRPDPDDLLPSAPSELLPPSDDAAAAGYEAVSSILASPLMLSLLVMVFTLAFVRYVLFGKHDG